jgi:hypothetical protein
MPNAAVPAPARVVLFGAMANDDAAEVGAGDDVDDDHKLVVDDEGS